MYVISPNTKDSRNVMNMYKSLKPSDKFNLIPLKKFKQPNMPIDLSIYADKISFSSIKDPFCIVIQNQEIADTLKNIFDLAWEESKRLSAAPK